MSQDQDHPDIHSLFLFKNGLRGPPLDIWKGAGIFAWSFLFFRREIESFILFSAG